MRSMYIVLVLFSCLCCAQFADAQTSVKNELPATMLKPYGRAFFDHEENLELVSSAVHFGFSFTGRQCTLYASVNDADAHNYLQYELDGVYQKKLKVIGDESQPISITATTDGPHSVWIYKVTEATTGPIIIQKITGNDLKVLKPSTAPLIEFIGNSITCGAAADTAEVPCGKGEYHDHHNAYYAYGPRVARALHVNFLMSSVSGIGIYRTWNADSPSMPQFYEKESFGVNDTMLWNFKAYTPKIVSIALGTNDLSRGDGVHPRAPFDSTVFVKDYIAFVQLVKSKYPKATVALLSSPMVSGDNRILLQNCLTTVKKSIDALYPRDKKVALFFFEPMQPHGCSGHPSVEDHAILAQELLPFFKELLK
jgi:Carbohydrate esterase 2 N-terminal/GDSL-like Lipase/Acylhydrolase family